MIETNDLSKQFNDFWAVDGVTLSVNPGQILALLGQNGWQNHHGSHVEFSADADARLGARRRL